ncbi:Shikimate O-hydroxycinnamoyltransferase [Colletotrichum siamense]|uniref:Shikimate O-hydroxycinnamoyltransferase n=1 Tax=Colletotrichum siamense TaxID=690259 RepID=A0A9P5ESL2_COLSI|nr:Shikimate O-hydroxycinnamoyltransferase [Colletotrichum siamense]KAF4859132.1 Shikimate O-hydroxycinnamoyltransferase [Colletotrichum siamense]
MLLGPIDHTVFPTVPTNVVFVYERPKSSPLDSFMSTQALQLSLTRLLTYYPHPTGRFQLNKSSNTFEIGNFSKGVVFLQAECDAILADIAAQSRSGRIIVENLPGSGNALIPPFEATIGGVCRDPILAVQHTRFACGGVALGIRLHHMVCDAGGFFQFVRDWSRVHQTSSLPSPPQLSYYLSPPDAMSAEDRSAALDGNPLFWYAEDPKPQPNPVEVPNASPTANPPVVGHTLHFSSEDLSLLKDKATNPSGQGWVSSFEAVSAYLCQATYKARLRLLEAQGVPPSSAASQLRRGFWSSIDTRDQSRLNLGSRYFGDASLNILTRFQHSTLADGELWEVAEVVHDLVRSMDKARMEKTTKWFAAQPDKSRIKLDFDFGPDNFTVSQWSKHDMYSGVDFEKDLIGNPVRPALVAPPFTEVSLVDGLALMVSTPPEEARERNADGATKSTAPQPIDAIFSVSEPVWTLLNDEEGFRKFVC